jgi:type VII secretion integral membrane protein EccD
MNTNLVVITGRRATDLSLPADPPIKDWIDEAVKYLQDTHQDDDDIGFAFDCDTVWSLAPVGAPPIRREESLNSAGLVDGNLVQLVPVSHTERYRPLVEDNIDAIAVLNRDPVFRRADVAHWLNWLIPVVAIGVAAAGVVGWSAGPGQRHWWGPALLALAMLFAVTAYRVWHRYNQPHTAESLLAATTVLATAGLALSVSLPREFSWLGAPHLAAAGYALLVAAVAIHGGPLRRSGVAAGVGTIGLITGVAATATAYGWNQWVWPGVVGAGLLTITNAAKLTVAFARIALPPVPAPGETMDLGELLDPVIDTAAESADPALQSWRAILESVPSSSARLVERSVLSQRLVTGFIAAGATALTVGSVALLQQGHFFPHTIAIAALVCVASVFRARFYANRFCAWSLLTAAAAIIIGCAAKMIHWYPTNAPIIAAVVGALATVAIFGFAASKETDRLSAITKRNLERIDGLSVASIVVLLFWVAGLYDIMRNIVH